MTDMEITDPHRSRSRLAYWLCLLIAVVALYFTTKVNYLLFHTIVELFSIIIASTVFIITWNSLRYIKNPYLITIGISYLFIGLLDLLHTLSFPGMPIFAYQYYANQVWIAARYMESITLLLGFIFLYADRKVRPALLFLLYLVVTCLLIGSIFYWRIFPVCFVEGKGLTPFKIYSEYAICAVLAASICMLAKNKRHFSPPVYKLIFLSMAFAIVSELAFTFYLDNYDISNLVGHYFKLFSFLMIYHAIVSTGIEEPYHLIFNELYRANQSLKKEIELRERTVREREVATEALRASEGKFRSLFESSPYAVLLTTPLGGIAAANPAASAIFGWSQEEICRIGHDGLICPDDSRHQAAAEERERSGRYINAELCFVRKNGEHFPCEADSVVLPGEPPTAFVIVRDITQRKETDAALKELNQELERRVEERTAELHEKDQLLLVQARLAAMGEMISNIAHQWRQPLNTLALVVQEVLLTYEIGEIDARYLESFTNRAMQLIQHMSRTVDDFRNFFKPGKEKDFFTLNDVVTRTLSLVEGTLKAQQIEVEVKVAEDAVVEGYPNEFSQVLLNILINARDVLAEREIAKPRVVIVVKKEAGRGVVTITDNAGGIAPGIIGKVFDPYFTTKGPKAGTGVGLSMSKTIIEKNMGGRLTVRNAESGAEFRIEV